MSDISMCNSTDQEESPKSSVSNTFTSPTYSLPSANKQVSANLLRTKEAVVVLRELELNDKYEVIKCVGSGAYGAVFLVNELATGKRYAVKKMVDIFNCRQPVNAKRLLREIQLNRLLSDNNCEGVVQFHEILMPADINSFNEICLVMDYMDTTMHGLIHSKQYFSREHIQFFMHQLLQAAANLHERGIVHRDIKPYNILVNENCTLKLCDLGLARNISKAASSSFRSLSSHVVTRWYRAPELMLMERDYDEKIDIWSIGCVFAEILQMDESFPIDDRKPLFPGHSCFPLSCCESVKILDQVKSDQDQLNVIMNILGTQEAALAKYPLLRDKLRKVKKAWKTIFPCADADALDLLDKLLCFNPKQRITAKDALQHPFLEDFVDSKSLPNVESDLSFSKHFKWENEALSLKQIKELVQKEIVVSHPVYCSKMELDNNCSSSAVTSSFSIAAGKKRKIDNN